MIMIIIVKSYIILIYLTFHGLKNDITASSENDNKVMTMKNME